MNNDQIYAIRELLVSAIDYMQKPVDSRHLLQAAEKVVKMKPVASQDTFEQNPAGNTTDGLSINGRTIFEPRRLSLPGTKGFTIIEVSNIVSIETGNNFSTFHLNGYQKIEVSKPIKEFEPLLDPVAFIRVHKSGIIHLKYLKEFSKVEGLFAIMADKSAVPVSRRRLSDFLKAVEEYNSPCYFQHGNIE